MRFTESHSGNHRIPLRESPSPYPSFIRSMYLNSPNSIRDSQTPTEPHFGTIRIPLQSSRRFDCFQKKTPREDFTPGFTASLFKIHRIHLRLRFHRISLRNLPNPTPGSPEFHSGIHRIPPSPEFTEYHSGVHIIPFQDSRNSSPESSCPTPGYDDMGQYSPWGKITTTLFNNKD